MNLYIKLTLALCMAVFPLVCGAMQDLFQSELLKQTSDPILNLRLGKNACELMDLKMRDADAEIQYQYGAEYSKLLHINPYDIDTFGYLDKSCEFYFLSAKQGYQEAKELWMHYYQDKVGMFIKRASLIFTKYKDTSSTIEEKADYLEFGINTCLNLIQFYDEKEEARIILLDTLKTQLEWYKFYYIITGPKFSRNAKDSIITKLFIEIFSHSPEVWGWISKLACHLHDQSEISHGFDSDRLKASDILTESLRLFFIDYISQTSQKASTILLEDPNSAEALYKRSKEVMDVNPSDALEILKGLENNHHFGPAIDDLNKIRKSNSFLDPSQYKKDNIGVLLREKEPTAKDFLMTAKRLQNKEPLQAIKAYLAAEQEYIVIEAKKKNSSGLKKGPVLPLFNNEATKELEKIRKSLSYKTYPGIIQKVGKDVGYYLREIDLEIDKEKELFLKKGLEVITTLKKSNPDYTDVLYDRGVVYEQGLGVEKNYKKAFDCYKIAADQGHIKAQLALALLYSDGLGVPKDEKVSFKYLQPIADMGNPEVQAHVGFMYDEGIGVDADEKMAFHYYKLAADKGYMKAQLKVSHFFLLGLGIPVDYKEAFKYLKMAAVLGDPEAELLVADWYIERGSEVWDENMDLAYYQTVVGWNENMAFQYYQLAFLHGNQNAQDGFLRLQKKAREMREEGLRLYNEAATLNKQDLSFDVGMLEQSAALGYSGTQYVLGLVFSVDSVHEGVIYEKDAEKAFSRFYAAALQKHPEATFEVGMRFLNGLGVKLDIHKAIQYLTKAIELGVLKAETPLGLLYLSPNHGIQDMKKAFMVLLSAARNKSPEAQFWVADCYAKGNGVGKSVKRAEKWYKKAALQQYASAQYALGCLYLKSSDMERNPQEGFANFLGAAIQKYTPAYCELAQCYEFGYGVDISMEEACQWYKQTVQFSGETDRLKAEEALLRLTSPVTTNLSFLIKEEVNPLKIQDLEHDLIKENLNKEELSDLNSLSLIEKKTHGSRKSRNHSSRKKELPLSTDKSHLEVPPSINQPQKDLELVSGEGGESFLPEEKAIKTLSLKRERKFLERSTSVSDLNPTHYTKTKEEKEEKDHRKSLVRSKTVFASHFGLSEPDDTKSLKKSSSSRTLRENKAEKSFSESTESKKKHRSSKIFDEDASEQSITDNNGLYRIEGIRDEGLKKYKKLFKDKKGLVKDTDIKLTDSIVRRVLRELAFYGIIDWTSENNNIKNKITASRKDVDLKDPNEVGKLKALTTHLHGNWEEKIAEKTSFVEFVQTCEPRYRQKLKELELLKKKEEKK